MSIGTPAELRALAEAAIGRGDNNVPNLDPATLLRLLDLAENLADALRRAMDIDTADYERDVHALHAWDAFDRGTPG